MFLFTKSDYFIQSYSPTAERVCEQIVIGKVEKFHMFFKLSKPSRETKNNP